MLKFYPLPEIFTISEIAFAHEFKRHLLDNNSIRSTRKS